MRLGVEHKLIQTHQLRLAKYQIEIFQGLCCPEGFHVVGFWGFVCRYAISIPVSLWARKIESELA